jgi:hypothetical protein
MSLGVAAPPQDHLVGPPRGDLGGVQPSSSSFVGGRPPTTRADNFLHDSRTRHEVKALYRVKLKRVWVIKGLTRLIKKSLQGQLV